MRQTRTVQVAETIDALRTARASLGGSVGVVLTMGALHDGHLALVEHARADNDAVLVTIFVNPTQFSADEDFDQYPRDLPADLDRLRRAGVDLVFTPTPALMYPPGFQTDVTVSAVTQRLEGEKRPGHFRGVTTVVAKLFNLTQPTRTYFGQKDAQQVVVLRRMVRDLNFPLQLVVCPTVREPDGLALSSRNVRLDPHQRAEAVKLAQALRAAAEHHAAGERDPDALRAAAHDVLETIAGGRIDYVSLADVRTLEEQTTPTDAPLLLSLAATFGGVRLLDNALLPAHLNDRDGLTATLGA